MKCKVWDSGRTHPGIWIKADQMTIKRDLNTRKGYTVATINCPLTGSDFLVAAQIKK